MTHDKQILNTLRAILVMLVIFTAVVIIALMPRKQEAKVIFDIDPGEMQAMSTDSLHPDPALVWRDTVNNISHVSFNFSKQ